MNEQFCENNLAYKGKREPTIKLAKMRKKKAFNDCTNFQQGLKKYENQNFLNKEITYEEKSNIQITDDKENKTTSCKMTLRPRKKGTLVNKLYGPVLKPLKQKDLSEICVSKENLIQLQTVITNILKKGECDEIFDFINVTSFVCVTKWATMSPTGFAYNLSNGSFGIEIPFDTHLFRSPAGIITYYSADYGTGTFTKDAVPLGLESLMTYTDTVRKEMLKLKRTGPSSPFMDIITVKAWDRFLDDSGEVEAMIFLLSNDSCQLNMANHEKMLVNFSENIIATWVDTDWCVLSFRSLQISGAPNEYRRKLVLVQKFLSKILSPVDTHKQ